MSPMYDFVFYTPQLVNIFVNITPGWFLENSNKTKWRYVISAFTLPSCILLNSRVGLVIFQNKVFYFLFLKIRLTYYNNKEIP